MDKTVFSAAGPGRKQKGRLRRMKIALQLYTVRDSIQSPDTLLSALERVKAMGYDGVEFAGLFGADPKEVREKLDALGLCAVGMHQNIDTLEKDLAACVADCVGIGCGRLVCSYSPANSREELDRLSRVLMKLRQACADAGLEAGYHNHWNEFTPLDGEMPIERIKGEIPLELDAYWAFHAGTDPAVFLLENPGRVALLHIKDGDRKGNPCAVGEGESDIQSTLDAANRERIPWGIVENDHPSPDGFSDAQRSIQNLREKYRF